MLEQIYLEKVNVEVATELITKLWTIRHGDIVRVGVPLSNKGAEKVDTVPNKYTEEVFETLAVLQKYVVDA